MTNGEHNLWLGNALQSAPEIRDELKKIHMQLRVQNSIAVIKELYSIPVSKGGIDTEDYAKNLRDLLEIVGFTID